jgi:hypothetical protein
MHRFTDAVLLSLLYQEQVCGFNACQPAGVSPSLLRAYRRCWLSIALSLG